MSSGCNLFAVFALACAACSAGHAEPSRPVAAFDDPAYALARSLESAGAFDDAITEYKRFFFHNRGNAERDCALVSIAYCCASMGKWVDAVGSLEESLAFCAGSAAREDRMLLIGVFGIAARDYDAASVVLQGLLFTSESIPIRKEAAFYLGISSVYAHEWEDAEGYFAVALSAPENAETLAAIRGMLSPGSADPGYKSAMEARVLSAIIPGLGQMYAGRQGEGAVSLLLNAGIIAWLGFLIASGDWADAAAVADFIFFRFYTGNIANAGSYAEERNKALDLERAKRILGALGEE